MTTPSYQEQPDLAIVALLSMLTRFPQCQCPRMSESIAAHMRYIALDERYAPVLRDAASRLCQEWTLLGAQRDDQDLLN